jgi:hypothetical protein
MEQHPAGVLDITATKPFLTSLMAFSGPPWLMLGDREHELRWGQNSVPVQPGRHHLQIFGGRPLRKGHAEMTVEVHPGARVPVFYAAPWYQRTPGAIGHEPVESPAKSTGIAMAVLGLGFLFVALVVGIVACVVVVTGGL